MTPLVEHGFAPTYINKFVHVYTDTKLIVLTFKIELVSLYDGKK